MRQKEFCVLLIVALAQSALAQSDTDAAPTVPAEPNTPSLPEQQVAVLLADPNLSDIPLQQLAKPSPPLRYHPLVTDRVFHVLGYPYYEGGLEYAAGPLADPLVTPAPSQPDSTDPDTPVPAAAAPLTDPNDQKTPPLTPSELTAQEQQLWQWMTLTHRWRQFNENPATALEVACGIELTRISTHIYDLAPETAVVVKRVMGQLGRVNRQYDRFSRNVLRDILARTCHPAALTEMDKLLSELPGLLMRLTEGNDAISVTLGAGEIDRTGLLCGQAEWIDYAALIPAQP